MLVDVAGDGAPDELLDRLARARRARAPARRTRPPRASRGSATAWARRAGRACERVSSTASRPATRRARRPRDAPARAARAGSRQDGSVLRRVGSHDERQRGIRIARMYGFKGIHGIGRAAALDLERAHGEPRRRRRRPAGTCAAGARDRDPAHSRRGALCGGVCAGISSTRSSASSSQRVAREREVPEVRRVERPAEDADARAPGPPALKRGRARRPRRGT